MEQCRRIRDCLVLKQLYITCKGDLTRWGLVSHERKLIEMWLSHKKAEKKTKQDKIKLKTQITVYKSGREKEKNMNKLFR